MNWVSESLSSILLPPEISGASANCCNHAGITPGPFQISFLLIEAGWIEQERLLSNPSDNIDKILIHIGMGRAFDIYRASLGNNLSDFKSESRAECVLEEGLEQCNAKLCSSE